MCGRHDRNSRRHRAKPRVADRQVHGGHRADRGAGDAPSAARVHHGQGRARAQPQEHRRRVSAGRAGRGDRRVGGGQVVADQRHPAAGAAPQAAGQLRSGRPPRRRRRHRRHRQCDRHRPEADRAHAAVEPGDVHEGIRRDPRRVRADARSARLRLSARTLLVQRARRPLRGVRGRRRPPGRDALPTRRLRDVRGVPRRRWGCSSTTARCAGS